LATAKRLIEDGVIVTTVDIAPEADIVADITDPASIAAAVDRIGPVDILINSAGIVGPNKPLWEISDQEWAITFAVNVSGTFNLCRAFIPGMRARRWGRIVNFASMAGKDGNPKLSAYSASKAAVIAMTKSLGKELASSGVLVNVIAPGCGGHPDECHHRAGRVETHHQPHPHGQSRTTGGSRRARGMASLRQMQLLHRCGLRHQRRTSHLLITPPLPTCPTKPVRTPRQ
jgi:NAD(P)-dependent dehydrogenase (short-subunit alcohol dehydrogenase family)